MFSNSSKFQKKQKRRKRDFKFNRVDHDHWFTRIICLFDYLFYFMQYQSDNTKCTTSNLMIV